MSNPLGQGERANPKNGNAYLTTYNLSGQKVVTPLWIDQFATDLNLQLDSAQLKKGLSHRPIRFTERFLTFSTLWNVLDRPKYIHLIEIIREHWAHNLNETRPTPMVLHYYGANKRWQGFIENASVGYAVTDVILRYQFQMRIIPAVSESISKVKGTAPFAPTSQDIRDFGPDWYTIRDFIAENVGIGNEGKNKQSRKKGDNPIDPAGPGR